MTIFQAFILGIIQGLTEFLPVSSSGHLALAQHFMGLPQVPIAFDVLLHMATLLAVVYVLFRPINDLVVKTYKAIVSRKINQIPKLLWLLIIGTIPAAILGLLFNDYMDTIFQSVKYFSIGFLITSILLNIASRIKSQEKSLKQMSLMESFKIGIFQAIAIFPSISRSGATISGTLFAGFGVKDAFTFSFLLSIPAILGASILHIKQILYISSSQIPAYFVGFITAAISGYIALLVFRQTLINKKLSIFAYYCMFLSLLIFFFVK